VQRQPLSAPNQEWAIDFASDIAASGQRLRVFSVVDAFTRECLARDTRAAEHHQAAWGTAVSSLRLRPRGEQSALSGLVCRAAHRDYTYLTGKAHTKCAYRKLSCAIPR
jgi:hypothetical protein